MRALRNACLAILLLHAASAGAQNITAYAGTGTAGYNGDDPAFTALTTQVNNPRQLAVDAAGNLYIADSANHRVRKVTTAGKIFTVAGTGTAGAALTELSSPSAVTVDASGNLYVADTSNHRVIKVAAGTGTATLFAGTGTAGNGADNIAATASTLDSPRAVVAEGVDVVYIADFSHRIRKVSGGIITTVAGVAGAPSCSATTLFAPGGLALSAGGDLYIADSNNNRIMKLSGGVLSVVVGGVSSCTSGINDGPVATAQLATPLGLAVTQTGDLLFADFGSNRVRRIRAGMVSTVVGSAGLPGDSGDNGPASAASMGQPTGLAAGPAGTYAYYVSDVQFDRVRKVTPVAPATPVLNTLTPGVGQVTAAFTPGADGGAPPTFTVSCTPGPVTQDGAASPIVVTGLANGVAYTCTVRGTNVTGASGVSGSLIATPGSAPSITSSPPPGGTFGVAYTHVYTATGAPAPTFTVTAGALPSGLTLSSSGTISGTPTNPGTFTGAVTAANGIAPASTQGFSVTIVKASQAIGFSTIPPTPLATGSITLTASGGASGNPVVFNSTTTAVCTTGGTNGATLTLVSVGSCSVTATQAGNANFDPATPVTQTFNVTKSPQVIAFAALPDRNFGEGPFTLSATGGGSGNPVTFGSTTPGTCTATGTNGTTLTLVGVGTCTIVANQAGNADYDPAFPVARSFAVAAATRLGNISTRLRVGTGNDVAIAGFIIDGTAPKRVAIVATGPSLAQYGIANPLANPTVTLVRQSDQATVAINDDWQTAPNAGQITALGYAPPNALESAILTDLAPGAYTAIVSGVGGGTGVAVIAVYEVDHPEFPLINISTRGQVLTGNDVMIGGFIIVGATTQSSQTVAIVGTGPSLAAYGITDPLVNPTLTLVRQSDQAVIATNDNWQTDPNAAQLQAAGFAPSNPLEAGIYITLSPGAYTAVMSGVAGGTGVGVIGVYAVD